MPSLGADMDVGKLVEWRVPRGARVKRGEIVALVETQKGIVEVEIWEDGVVEDLVVAPGAEVPVGTVLATLRSADGGRATPLEAATKAVERTTIERKAVEREAVDSARVESPRPVAVVTRSEEPARPRASPAARQLARELGVDLGGLQGTGPHGAITRADVEHASEPPPSETRPSVVTTAAPPQDDAGGMRRAIAAAMAKSKREIPHYYLSTDIDVTHATRWLQAENAKRSVTERILFAALLVKATALAARSFPALNGFFVDGVHKRSDAVHVGVAVSMRQGGLVAPAVHDVEKRRLLELMNDLRDLVGRVRHGRLRASELTDATITVTNLGETGVASVFGVIYPPQVAIVGFGKPTERAWAENGMVGVRTIVTATLAGDHRVSDGHAGALFLEHIARSLSEPEKL